VSLLQSYIHIYMRIFTYMYIALLEYKWGPCLSNTKLKVHMKIGDCETKIYYPNYLPCVFGQFIDQFIDRLANLRNKIWLKYTKLKCHRFCTWLIFTPFIVRSIYPSRATGTVLRDFPQHHYLNNTWIIDWPCGTRECLCQLRQSTITDVMSRALTQ
jgi:hypothetical protein